MVLKPRYWAFGNLLYSSCVSITFTTQAFGVLSQAGVFAKGILKVTLPVNTKETENELTEKNGTTGKSNPKGSRYGFRFGISLQIQLTILMVVMISMACMGLIAHYFASEALEGIAIKQLASIKENKRRFVEYYFTQQRKQLLSMSEDPTVLAAAKAFIAATDSLREHGFPEDYDPETASNSLGAYYQNEFMVKVGDNRSGQLSLSDLVPEDPLTQYFQYTYISANPHQTGGKDLLESPDDGTLYAEAHQKYHPYFRNFLKEFGYYDIFLIDPKEGEGRVVYSVFKEIDYMTSLVSGAFNESSLSRVFLSANTAGFTQFAAFEDYAPYVPSYNAPALFIASPVYDGKEIVAILAFQASISEINNIMTGNQQWRADGLGNSGETYLVGKDYMMRSISRHFLENPARFYDDLLSAGYTQEVIDNIRRFGTTILQIQTSNEAVDDALIGNSGHRIYTNYRNKKVISSYTPLKLRGVTWAIVAEIELFEAFNLIDSLTGTLLVSILLIFLFALLASYFYSKRITSDIQAIQKTLVRLSRGEPSNPMGIRRKDEIGRAATALNMLIKRTAKVAAFAQAIGKRDFTFTFEPSSKADQLGHALSDMRTELIKVAEEDKHRNWASEGLAMFSDLLRENSTQIKLLTDAVLEKTIEYLDCVQGAFYIIEETKDGNQYLACTACFAFNRKKQLAQRYERGDGLIGQAWVDGEPVYIDDIPENYVRLRTGLGDALPTSLYIVPLKFNEQVFGLMELSSFRRLEAYERGFLEKLSESIASTISLVQNNEKTTRLLQESQEMAENLKAQEEEMRQNLEELQATQEALSLKYENIGE